MCGTGCFAIFPCAIGIAFAFVAFGNTDVGVFICWEAGKVFGATIVVGWFCTDITRCLIEDIAIIPQSTGPELFVDARDVGFGAVFSRLVAGFGAAAVSGFIGVTEVTGIAAAIGRAFTSTGQASHQFAIGSASAGLGTWIAEISFLALNGIALADQRAILVGWRFEQTAARARLECTIGIALTSAADADFAARYIAEFVFGHNFKFNRTCTDLEQIYSEEIVILIDGWWS